MADVDRGCPQRHKSRDLLPVIIGAKVQVKAALAPLGLGSLNEKQPRCLVRRRADLELERIVVDKHPAKRVLPPPPQPHRVMRLDDYLLPTKTHLDRLQVASKLVWFAASWGLTMGV